MLADLRRAFSLLTILPAGGPVDTEGSPGRAMAFFTVVGAVIGGVLAGVAALLEWSGLTGRVSFLAAALVLVVWTALTGALHLDGWADCCDGLFVPVDRTRRLEIMKDPHVGGFGVVGLVLLLAVKWAALAWVLTTSYSLLALVAVPTLARWAAVIAARSFSSARPGGMGDAFRQGLGGWSIAVATLVALATALPLLWVGAVVWAVVVAAFLALAFLARARLGGLSGDVYGGIIELGEAAALVALCFL
jgi:adenosylcobinamide-GDP ribazoletransferase